MGPQGEPEALTAVPEQARPSSEAGGGESLGQACSLDVGTARRVKEVLPPGSGAARYDGPGSKVEFKGRLYFSLYRQNSPRELWQSDGTETGTFSIKEFPLSSSGGPEQLTPAQDQLFFVADDPAHGRELWVSDGTSVGTRLVADLTPGAEGSSLNLLAGLGQRLAFIRGQTGTSPTPSRFQLWASQGTLLETAPLVDLGEGVEGNNWQRIRMGNAVLFFFRSPRGNTLWRTDGTVSGTAALRLLDSGPESAHVQDVRAEGGTAFFTLIEPDGATEIWRTDGSAGGTVRLHTLGGDHRVSRLLGRIGPSLFVVGTDTRNQRMSLFQLSAEVPGGREPVLTLPNPYASQPDAFPYFIDVASSGGKLFFATAIGSPGPAPRTTQLWVTNGTSAGTVLLREPVSNSDEYVPLVQSVADNLVLFPVYEGGPEPWVTDGTVSGTRAVAYAGAGGRPSAPGLFTRVGQDLFFSARDSSEHNQLWSVPLLSTCTAEEREGPGRR
ncbi:ELWxxDGT repeat protein [Stigmatella aurantiaca]|nr:ELWxxDGT repeat protein [Stigmatella aurantiaca]